MLAVVETMVKTRLTHAQDGKARLRKLRRMRTRYGHDLGLYTDAADDAMRVGQICAAVKKIGSWLRISRGPLGCTTPPVPLSVTSFYRLCICRRRPTLNGRLSERKRKGGGGRFVTGVGSRCDQSESAQPSTISMCLPAHLLLLLHHPCDCFPYTFTSLEVSTCILNGPRRLSLHTCPSTGQGKY